MIDDEVEYPKKLTIVLILIYFVLVYFPLPCAHNLSTQKSLKLKCILT